MEIVTKDNIDSILQKGENNTVEFQVGGKSVIKALPRTISAFANTEGGVIILGYDERRQIVIGTSTTEFEIINRVILEYKLEDVCNTYIVPYQEKTLMIIQVKKSRSVVIAGGGAYIRKGDANISVLRSKDVVERIISSTDETFESISSKETLKRVEEKLEQVYDEMLRSQKAYEEEIKNQKEEHKKELKTSHRSNWLFCILGAVLGAVLGVILGKLF